MSVLKESKNLSAMPRNSDRKPETFMQHGTDMDKRSVSVDKRGKKTMYAKKSMRNGKDFEVYRFVFETAIEIFEEIFETSRSFPKEKTFLTEQIRKHARLVCTNLAEAWHMKKQKACFINKLSDAAQAASKTQLFLEYSSKYNYIDHGVFRKLDSKYEDIFDILCDVTRD
ncbi:MAG: four helix bundle protein [Thermodesulfovibrionales bacterium]|nr:four helix bundle protein [Thermodesulfovibrionales bacterium]